MLFFSHLQEDYEQGFISLHSFESQNNSPRENFLKVNKIKSELFDEQEDGLDAHNMVVRIEYVQGCMNVFVEKPIVSISFEVILITEEVEKEQQTLMKETCLSVFVHQEEVFSHVFYDPVACYMECFNNQEFTAYDEL
jgi:hypothetical protein